MINRSILKNYSPEELKEAFQIDPMAVRGAGYGICLGPDCDELVDQRSGIYYCQRYKDTSGPSMNILIKLMAVVSLVFAPLFF